MTRLVRGNGTPQVYEKGRPPIIKASARSISILQEPVISPRQQSSCSTKEHVCPFCSFHCKRVSLRKLKPAFLLALILWMAALISRIRCRVTILHSCPSTKAATTMLRITFLSIPLEMNICARILRFSLRILQSFRPAQSKRINWSLGIGRS